ncbi:hypothetical protein [Escherichia coli]|uniref:hypothetical protein n=1 Tax=Escherichia coli TaxID=562 RepID=UPI00180F397D|nr:hypothetical protein [Escherichia coli]EFE1844404.1 hypothetical protein [Escherichia coli]EFE2430668.1 hypothetical protein [Escherichia coli]EFI6898618.1 hypothetical protein [Escherichia coli]EIG1746554.1 hypothetical protein [Escherichia coli]EIX2470795.1 hypothetical protein [Escherichia coli]
MKKEIPNILNCSSVSVIVVGKTGKGVETLINACFRTKPKHIVIEQLREISFKEFKNQK